MLENILNLLYPNVCGVCNKISKEAICKKCEIKIKKYEINYLNRNRKIYFDEIFCVYKYEGIIRDMLIKYKFQNDAYLYKTFIKILLKNKKLYSFLEKYDIIIPVPISKQRKQKRGYNQTQLISSGLAKELNIKCESKILVKVLNNNAQSSLNKKDRIENVKNAFKLINLYKIKDKNVLIFDDIYTTGSTVNECAKLLKEANTKKVGILTIAKD